MYNLFAHGEAKASEGGSITEGIGLGRVTPIIADMKVDKPYLIPDEEAVPMIFDLLEHEGLCLGGSSGINVAGAIRLAKDLGPGHTIVTVLADYGTRYQSKLFNPEFLRSKNLPVPEWLERKSDDSSSVREERETRHADRLPVPRRLLSEGMRGARASPSPSKAASCSTARCSTPIPAASPATPARSPRPTARALRSPTPSTPTRPRAEIAHVPAPGSPALKVGDTVTAAIDWDKRYARMRMHTALHLLSAVLPYAVTGGSVGESESRLDFDIPEAGLDKDAITAKRERDDRDQCRRHQPLDQRRRARRQSRPGQDHVGASRRWAPAACG